MLLVRVCATGEGVCYWRGCVLLARVCATDDGVW